ncbi:unnamed protein product [Chironomus riparius]|uniref:Eclosion hormone n=1 Tax=Chironomus riparius TaxID=315576 RepID=A0A9N9WZU0_9DIPT|nr:unnamed protein product [Chironomus riparius]
MSSPKLLIFITFIIAAAFLIDNSSASPYPSLDLFGGYDIVGICLKNCAQCKKMFGGFFEGQLCAESCVKFKGKVIPDCEDLASIAPFLNTKEE